MAEAVLVDTDILIDVGLGVESARSCLEEIEQRSSLAVSVISQMELMVSCRNKTEQRKLDRFLTRTLVVQTTEEISEMAVALLRDYHLSHGLLIADALIASTAISRGMAFITKNRRDYRFIAQLKPLSYPSKTLT